MNDTDGSVVCSTTGSEIEMLHDKWLATESKVQRSVSGQASLVQASEGATFIRRHSITAVDRTGIRCY